MDNIKLYDKDLEEVVLGQALLEGEAKHAFLDVVTPSQMYFEPNRITLEAMLSLHKKNDPVDILTVIQELKRVNKLDLVGGAYFISTLTNKVASSANIEFHVRILQQYAFKRSLLMELDLTRTAILEHNSDFFEIEERLIKKVTDITQGIETNSTFTIDQLAGKVIQNSLEAREGKIQSVPVKIDTLQKLLGGLKNGRLTVIAARPGMGKTVVGLELGMFAAKSGFPALILSQEMTGEELAERQLSASSGIEARKISNYQINSEELTYLAGVDLKNVLLYIDDTSGLTIQKLINKARKMKREKDIKLLIVDYLQLCESETGTKESREQEISKISRGLKRLAKELQIPVIALSQLNRKNEDRSDRKPQLADLRDSGAIEQDADTVILLHRPEYYGIQEYELGKQNLKTENLMLMIVAKNRGGMTGEIPCTWIGSTMEIKNYK